MWKHLNRPTSPTTLRIGNPILIETTLDRESAATLRDLHSDTRHTPAGRAAQGHSGDLDSNVNVPLTLYDNTTHNTMCW